jgi:putative ABC transport system permease protein
MSWASAQNIAQLEEVSWTIPISMGDSHRGFPAVATDNNFFEHFKYRRDKSLKLAQGRPFKDIFEVVLGSEVAAKLGYRLNSSLVLRHGLAQVAPEHSDKPFTAVGILEPTGTAVDRSLYVNLESMEAIHVDWRGGAPIRGFSVPPELIRKFNLKPKSVTALLVGLKNRRRVFDLQSKIQNSPGEALTAALPGVALDQLYSLLGTGEKALTAVSILVTVTGLMGLIAAVMAGLGERRGELAILRSVGARPLDVMILLTLESLTLTLCGVAIGLAALFALIAAIGPILADRYGLIISLSVPSTREWLYMGAVVLSGFLAGLAPAIRAYFISLADGLTVST